VPSKDCKENPWQQLNSITSFLDMSLVYGNNDVRANQLRDISQGKGLLKYTLKPNSSSTQMYLPNDPYITNCAIDVKLKCGLSGDNRTSEQPGLTALHTVFLRYHNQIATSLSEINQNWLNDRLYEETRRILGAIFQRITYSEYLPAILDASTRRLYGLELEDSGRNGAYYSPFVNPSVLNEFSSAAFRFGHSQVPSSITRVNRYYEPYQPILLRFAFHNASIVYDDDNGGIDGILLGQMVTPLSQTDESLSEEITEHLVPRPIDGPGRDLFAINIQRGRDHGLASYNKLREACGLKLAHNFDDLLDSIRSSTIEKLKSIYKHVDDIDLYAGGICETPVRGGSIGPTFSCIIGLQFLKLKIGDYFWHERSNIQSSFTYEQLQEIRKVTMARVFCDTLQDVWRIQPDVFRLPSYKNSRVTCDDLPNLNLNLWNEP
ncbi:peroxidasin homolog pxn-1-like, partial [Antedon mediterranea]|uniref:peroxidasin homolog pxn-1-like n=1 Tax=Antedon mediterranea TaxID=105859 RepID=UPI003AF78E40